MLRRGLLGLCLAAGCYGGLEGNSEDIPPGADGADDGDGANDGDGDDDGDGSDDSDDGPAMGQCGEVDIGLSPLRRLTRAQYRNAVQDLLHVEVDVTMLPDDERADAVGAFASNVLAPASENVIRDYLNAAEAISVAALQGDAPSLTTIGDVLPCDPAVTGAAECARSFITQFGRRAFRRPLEPEEVADFEAVFASVPVEEGFGPAIALVTESMLQSPDFLYLLELGVDGDEGEAVVALGNFELATRLAFFLGTSTPDDALLDAAQSGALATPDGLRAEAERLLESPRGRDAIASFHTQWLRIDKLGGDDKSDEVYPDYDAELAQAMIDETEDFADYVIRRGDGRLATLLTAPFTIAHPRLLALYGTDPDAADADGIAPLDATQRAGLLTQASLLSAHAHADQASLVLRGALIRKNFLCNALPPPPPEVDLNPPEIDPNQSARDRFDEHRNNPSCSGCHDMIDPIGYGLLAYDGIGRRMELDGNQPIDETGNLSGIGLADDAFEGPVELAALLAESPMVQRCVAQQWTTFAVGHPLGSADVCAIESVRQSFEDSDGNIPELLLAIVASDSFRFRRIAD